jgi:hypothetical protein
LFDKIFWTCFHPLKNCSTYTRHRGSLPLATHAFISLSTDSQQNPKRCCQGL